jgi:MerR family copper efflux transcriptional regulator
VTTKPGRAIAFAADMAAKVACTLDAGDLEARLAEWRAVAAEASDRRRIDGGLRLTFDDIDVRALTDLAIREHECCAFLSFAVGIGSGGTTLDITGPAPVLGLIDALV